MEDFKMARRSKKEYRMAIYKRYHLAEDKEKGRILDEFTKVCKYNRKYAIRALRKFCKEDPDIDRNIKLLQSIPGIGYISATYLLALIGYPNHLENKLESFFAPKKPLKKLYNEVIGEENALIS